MNQGTAPGIGPAQLEGNTRPLRRLTFLLPEPRVQDPKESCVLSGGEGREPATTSCFPSPAGMGLSPMWGWGTPLSPKISAWWDVRRGDLNGTGSLSPVLTHYLAQGLPTASSPECSDKWHQSCQHWDAEPQLWRQRAVPGLCPKPGAAGAGTTRGSPQPLPEAGLQT